MLSAKCCLTPHSLFQRSEGLIRARSSHLFVASNPALVAGACLSPGTPCLGAKSYFSTFNPARAPGERWALGVGAARARLAVACALAGRASPSLPHLPTPCLGRMTGREKAAASVPVCVSVGGRRRGLVAMQ